MNTNQPDKNDDRPISLPTQPRPHGLMSGRSPNGPVCRARQFPTIEDLKDSRLIDVHREGTCNYYYLSIEDSTRKLMQLGHLLESVLSMDA